MKIEHSCKTCQYNFTGNVCANHATDKDIDDLYGYDTKNIRKDCNGWRISFRLYQQIYMKTSTKTALQ